MEFHFEQVVPSGVEAFDLVADEVTVADDVDMPVFVRVGCITADAFGNTAIDGRVFCVVVGVRLSNVVMFPPYQFPLIVDALYEDRPCACQAWVSPRSSVEIESCCATSLGCRCFVDKVAVNEHLNQSPFSVGFQCTQCVRGYGL